MTEEAAAPGRLDPWAVVGSPRIVFEHAFHATILEEDLRLPNGHELPWLRYADARDGVDIPDGVMGICMREGEVLLSRQYNPGADRVVWEFPGGGTHVGEDYPSAVRRELMEEVGQYPNDVEYLGRFLLNNRRWSWGIRTFLATNLETRHLPADDGELIDWQFVPASEITEMIRGGEIDNCTLLAGWALLQAAGKLS